MTEVTTILKSIAQGDPQAASQLLPLVYTELRRLAAARMANESPGHTLQPTALVHEAYLRLVGDPERKWDGRGHFFGAAAEAMRRILIDQARRKRAIRHGGGLKKIDVAEIDLAGPTAPDELLEVSDALDRFAEQDKPKAELVKLRYFAGLTIEEAAEAMGVSVATAKRWWTFSRAWLYRELAKAKD